MKKHWVGTAGFILAVFLMGCGSPNYQLDGAAKVQQVALLDSTTKLAVDSLHAEFRHLLVMVAKSEVAAIDSMHKSASALGPSISNAEKALRDARANYKTTFQKMEQFRSFGGNSVFSEDDVAVSTRKLLTEIAERFYKGRAFSLEMEGQIRGFIRRELVPREAQVNKARNRVTRLKRSQKGRSEAKATIVEATREKRHQLVQATNKEIQNVIWEHRLLVRAVDGASRFVFEHVEPGTYFLCSGIQESIQVIVPIRIDAHTHQKFGLENGHWVLVANTTEDSH